MISLYGTELLLQIQCAYQDRCQKAVEHGFDRADSQYHWLYLELEERLKTLQESLLYLEALPKFLVISDGEKICGYLMEYIARYFSPANIGTTEGSKEGNPFFKDGNPYWRDVQEAIDAFNEPGLLGNLPLLYIYCCELVTRSVRLYFQVREGKCRAIDRKNFDSLMRKAEPVPRASQTKGGWHR